MDLYQNSIPSTAYHQVILHTSESEYLWSFVRNGRVRHYGQDIVKRYKILMRDESRERIFRVLSRPEFKRIHYHSPNPSGGHPCARWETDAILEKEELGV